MITLNTKLNADAFDNSITSTVGVRFGDEESLTLTVSKSDWFTDAQSHYQIDLLAEGPMPSAMSRGLTFEASMAGLTIGVKDKQDVEQLKAAFLSAAQILEMYQENHVPESIGVTLHGLPNHKQTESIFDEQGEPYQYVPLFNESGQFIHPELPFPHPLNVKPKGQFTDYKEFNHLRLTNLNQFLSDYGNNISYYESPFSILAQLEAMVKFEEFPEAVVSVSYKDFGDILFSLHAMYQDGDRRIVEYTYTGSAS